MLFSPSPQRVLVIGGGFAALELVLALRDLAGGAVEAELIADDPQFRYRPAATAEVFAPGEPLAYDLDELTARCGATFRRGRVVSVLPAARRVRLASGETRPYDALVLAMGARRRNAIPGARTFRDQRDVAGVRAVVDAAAAGRLSRVVFAAPVGITWTLPLYELAMLAARRVDDAGAAASVSLVTPERRPLEVFGRWAGGAVAELLADHGVHVIANAQPRAVTREGLELRYDGRVAADAVVAVPCLAGAPPIGIPGDWNGFVATGPGGRVPGLDGVFAAGDVTAFPVKQGGLAAQQADVVAAAIAADLDCAVEEPPPPPTLRAVLLSAEHPLYLQCELDARGRPVEQTSSIRETPELAGKVAARRLPALLERVGPATVGPAAA